MTKSLRLFIALGVVVAAYSFAVFVLDTRAGDEETISIGGEFFELETIAEDISYFPPVDDGGLGAMQAATPVANPGGGSITKNTIINIETPTP